MSYESEEKKHKMDPYERKIEECIRLRTALRGLAEALRLAELAWYERKLPNDWYTDVTKDYYNEEFSGLSIGQAISKIKKAAIAAAEETIGK